MWSSDGPVETYDTHEVRDPLAAAVGMGRVYVLLRSSDLADRLPWLDL